MGIYKRGDASVYWMWIPGAGGKRGQRIATPVPVNAGSEREREANRIAAEDYYTAHIRRLTRQSNQRIASDLDGRFTYVYFVEDEQGRIKIGQATNPETRIKALRLAQAGPLKVLAVSFGHMGLESRLHRQFQHLRLKNEWYSSGDDLRLFVSAVSAGHHPMALLAGLELSPT